MIEKLDKSKKLRLSLDKFVPKNRQVSKCAFIFQRDIKSLSKSQINKYIFYKFRDF